MSKKPSKRIHIPLKEKLSEFKIDMDESDITLPAVIMFLGCRGRGKTYVCIYHVHEAFRNEAGCEENISDVTHKTCQQYLQ